MEVTTPLTDETVARLKAGDRVTISGTLYVARDAAHKRLVAALQSGEPLPFDPRGQIIYYMGPSPARPGKPCGSAGPTAGLKGMLGKGSRSQGVRDALKQYRAVYLAALGGAAALLGRAVTRAECIAYEDLGPEAVLRLEVEGLPAIVVNDMYGGDAYELGRAQYRR
jgi:fumarate hydratase subunit beta